MTMPGDTILTSTFPDLEELIGFVAARSQPPNHESNRRRQRPRHPAYDALDAAARTLNGK
ncbi:MAG TPA: hypothetical protein VE197_03940 [Mycobacterium sp.]|nr:hypothetical protein [Mycobacterium sp.]